ncbi:MAG: FABP family protein [Rhodoglobus sp.]
MIELDPTIPAELAPLSWLIGLWEGSGVVNYAIGDETRNLEFGQRLSFTHDGLPYLNYTSYTWLLDQDKTPHATETGYWRLSRRASEGDQGPGLLPGIGERIFTTATAVETLRTDDGAFDIEVAIVHPAGVSELYLGQVKGPRIDLATDAVMRTATAKEYAAATRIYGLVESHLLWAWDIAALGQDLRTHASGRLARVE